MAVLSVQKIVAAGLSPSLASAAGGGDSFPNTGHEFVEVTNGDASPHTVTAAAQVNCDYGVDSADHDIAVAVPAGETRRIGPFDPRRFNDANGRVQLTYDAVTSVTVGAFSLAGS